ncbi:MAG: hypothetical protein R3D70_24280, partial [Rhizobiaceae bacterium]
MEGKIAWAAHAVIGLETNHSAVRANVHTQRQYLVPVREAVHVKITRLSVGIRKDANFFANRSASARRRVRTESGE